MMHEDLVVATQSLGLQAAVHVACNESGVRGLHVNQDLPADSALLAAPSNVVLTLPYTDSALACPWLLREVLHVRRNQKGQQHMQQGQEHSQLAQTGSSDDCSTQIHSGPSNGSRQRAWRKHSNSSQCPQCGAALWQPQVQPEFIASLPQAGELLTAYCWPEEAIHFLGCPELEAVVHALKRRARFVYNTGHHAAEQGSYKAHTSKGARTSSLYPLSLAQAELQANGLCPSCTVQPARDNSQEGSGLELATLQDVEWAASLVCSRTFQSSLLHTMVMVPLLDMANHTDCEPNAGVHSCTESDSEEEANRKPSRQLHEHLFVQQPQEIDGGPLQLQSVPSAAVQADGRAGTAVPGSCMQHNSLVSSGHRDSFSSRTGARNGVAADSLALKLSGLQVRHDNHSQDRGTTDLHCMADQGQLPLQDSTGCHAVGRSAAHADTVNVVTASDDSRMPKSVQPAVVSHVSDPAAAPAYGVQASSSSGRPQAGSPEGSHRAVPLRWGRYKRRNRMYSTRAVRQGEEVMFTYHEGLRNDEWLIWYGFLPAATAPNASWLCAVDCHLYDPDAWTSKEEAAWGPTETDSETSTETDTETDREETQDASQDDGASQNDVAGVGIMAAPCKGQLVIDPLDGPWRGCPCLFAGTKQQVLDELHRIQRTANDAKRRHTALEKDKRQLVAVKAACAACGMTWLPTVLAEFRMRRLAALQKEQKRLKDLLKRLH